MTWDAVVVGAGPAGSLSAYRLSKAGARVLLVDRARFPRDKPCGGGLTLRAVKQLPFGVDPVVEHTVDTMAFRLRYGPSYVRRAREPLILMTQRRRLDAYLAEQAVAAGAEFRDGTKVTAIAEDGDGFTVELGDRTERCRLLVGADGANGIAARELDLCREPVYGVALEGNLPNEATNRPARYAGKAVVELGVLPGGYAWVFPKGDHLNFGIGGWESQGPELRAHLKTLCDAHGVDADLLESIRGHRLPLRTPEAKLARGRALVVGDAAGLVDPLSGDGMYEAFLSARLATEAATDVLEGRAETLEPYEAAVCRALGRLASASWGAKHAFDRFPRLAFALSKPSVVWPVVEGLLRGDLSHPGAAGGLARGPLKVVQGLSRLSGSQDARYRVEGAGYVQDYRLATLANGERVVTERLAGVRSVAIGFWIGTGSRDEDSSKAGVSHFIEHLLFKGTRSYSAQEIAEIFDGIGGELNAMTTREYTVVYARIMDDHLETALDVMTDMVYAPRLDDLDSEREVVLEEIAMVVEDTPQELVHDLVGEAIFGRHPLGRPIIGSADVIATVSSRALRAYHRSRYVSPSTVVAAAGSVDHDRLVELLAEHGKKRAAPPTRSGQSRRALNGTPPPRLMFQRKSTEQYHVCVGAPAISRADPRRFAASALDGILGGSASSRLFQEIREKRGLAYNVYTFAALYEETGEFGVYVGTREENLVECLEILAREVTDIASGGVAAAELRRAKESLKGRIMLSMESTSNRANRLGKSIVTETELLSLDEILESIEAVTAEDVASLAAEILPSDRLSFAGIGSSERRFRQAVRRVNPELAEATAA